MPFSGNSKIIWHNQGKEQSCRGYLLLSDTFELESGRGPSVVTAGVSLSEARAARADTKRPTKEPRAET
jgi:hypothetical protein